MALSQAFYSKLAKISAEVGMNPRDLLLVMYSESGLQSAIVNQDKKNGGAVGLIQFMPDTLRGLGVPKDQIKDFGNKSAEDQLDYVKKYIKGQMGYSKRPFKSASEYYHANFFPKTLKRWVGSDPIENANVIVVSSTATDPLERGAYKANKGLDSNHDGIITVSDMTAVLMRLANNNGFQQALSNLNSVAGAGQVSEISKNPELIKIKKVPSASISMKQNPTSSVDNFLDSINKYFLSFFPGIKTTASQNGITKYSQKISVPKLSHNKARDALAQAYRNLYRKEPTDGELDFGLATAFFESGYGRAGSANWAHPGQFAKWSSEGKYNWGALQSASPSAEKTFNAFKSAGLHPTKEKGNDAGRPVYFYLFPTDVEAAQAFLMSWGKPDTLKAAATGSSTAVAKSMKNHNYYEGFWVPPGNPRKLKMPPFKEAGSVEEAERNNIRDYASALKGHRSVVSGSSNHKEPEQMASQSVKPSVSIDNFLNSISEYFSKLFPSAKFASDNRFVISALGVDVNTKAEYFRILQSVLQEEIGVISSIHGDDSSIELVCDMPFSHFENQKCLKEVSSAVSDAFKFATIKIGGCDVIPLISSKGYSDYEEIGLKTAEINRRKFQIHYQTKKDK